MIKLRNKLIAAFLTAALLASFGQPVRSEEWEDETALSEGEGENADETEEGDSAADERERVHTRKESDVLSQAKPYAENDNFILYVVETSDYVKTVRETVSVLDGEGKPVMVQDESGKYQPLTEEVENVVEYTDNETMFAVYNKKNGFVWWSSPVNAMTDSVAKGAQRENMMSALTFEAGNPSSYTTMPVRSKKDSANFQSRGAVKNNTVIKPTSKNDGGVSFTFNFESKYTSVTMDVTLDGDSVLVEIPQDKIIENKITAERGEDDASVMLTLSVLSSFGAAPEGEEGYIVVPDGSGAIIEFDNKKVNSAPYTGQVYGRDFTVSQKFAPPVNEQVYFPMYSIVRKNTSGDGGDNALLAIAEKGDENAIIKANVSRQSATSYNAAWFDFRTRTTDSYYIGTRNNELSIYEQGKIKTGDLAIRYYPLAGDDLDYVDVADAYRGYLEKHKGLTKKTKDGYAPYYLTLNGGTVKTHSIGGFPVDLQTDGTTYRQAKEILALLKSGGVDDIVVTFKDFNTAGIKREISPTVQYSSKLGGKSKYKELSDYVSQNNFTMYPSFNFMEYYKSGNGYSYLLNSSKQVTKAYAAQRKYEYAFGTPDGLADSWTILSPFYFPGVFDKLTASLKNEGITSVSLDKATYLLYSDFSRKNPFGGTQFNRRDTVQILTEGYKKLNDEGISILAQSANAYALPYVSEITNVPLYSSNYDIFDYDIPLYQIIIHGYIPYSAKAFNASADSDTLRLLALSAGTPLHYDFIYKNPSKFTDSDYNKKFYANYVGWTEKSINEYVMFKDLIADISGERIIGHKRLSVYEVETVFEGGKTFYVNTDTGELKVNGRTVDFGDYGLAGRYGDVG
ncbi:MAG: DUF5696 domain-containing protein [Oscillospiraceae bacterium]|jgi:hypothetical protein|nr:DUF5696 domain-containing protein [Oscillospiraceae bacterium]